MIIRNLTFVLALAAALALAQIAPSTPICPTTIENDPPATVDACGILLTVNPDRHVSITLTGTGAYDGTSDTTFGIINQSGLGVASLSLNGGGAGLTLFAGNGIRNYISANEISIPPLDPLVNGYEDYYGPSTTFSAVDQPPDSLSVDFTGSLLAGASTYFSLPGDPQTDYLGLTGPSGSVLVTPASSAAPEASSFALLSIASLTLFGAVSMRRWTPPNSGRVHCDVRDPGC